MWSFVHNWWYHAQKAAMPGLLVIAMDDETKEKCDAAGALAALRSAALHHSMTNGFLTPLSALW